MRRMLFAVALAAAALTGCESLPSAPAIVAGHTVVDEKAAIAVETAYTAAAKAASLAIRTGVVSNPATIRMIGDRDQQAHAAVQAVRSAYNGGNAASYASAFAEADSAVKALLAAF